MVPNMNNKIVSVTPPQAIVDNASWTTAAVDTYGYDWCDFIVYFGAMDIAMVALKVQESEDSGMSGATDVTNGNFATGTNPAGSATALPSATDDNKFFAVRVDCRTHKRYLDLVATNGDGAVGSYLTAFAVLSRPESSPESTAERGFANELICP